MRLFISFLLSLFLYLVIVFFFILILKKTEQKKEVLIHTAIVLPNKTKSIVNNHTKKVDTLKKKSAKKTKKVSKKTQGSKSAFTKGGDVDINDIFKSVNYNIDTKKIHQKKNLQMSRFKKIESSLKKVKLLKNVISYENSGGNISNKEIENLIAKKLSPIWDLVSNIAGEYAKINIVFDGKVEVKIIDSNLPQDKQNLLIEKIKSLTFDKPINITVKFITKANK
jgi:hypothetical protein